MMLATILRDHGQTFGSKISQLIRGKTSQRASSCKDRKLKDHFFRILSFFLKQDQQTTVGRLPGYIYNYNIYIYYIIYYIYSIYQWEYHD